MAVKSNKLTEVHMDRLIELLENAAEERNVFYSEMYRDGNSFELREKCVAKFIGLGIGFEELNGGIAHYSTAIIKLPDGSIENAPLNCIRFVSSDDAK
jgi:hypothetical protein